MHIRINEIIFEKLPTFKIGMITYEDITVSAAPQMLRGRLQLYQESMAIDLDSKGLTDYQGVREWRNVFKVLGMDPSKYRPSHEAMIRRIAKRQFLDSIHSAADINNFFSIQYEIPIGIYDLCKIKGDIEIRMGSDEESYDALNNRIISATGKIVSSDTTGVFGSPFVDSKRTVVTEETKSALQIVYLKPSMSTEEGKNLLQSMSKMFNQVNGGSATFSIIQK